MNFLMPTMPMTLSPILGREAEFCARVIVVRERMESKEQETTGIWLTEEKMKKSGDYSPLVGCMSQMIWYIMVSLQTISITYNVLKHSLECHSKTLNLSPSGVFCPMLPPANLGRRFVQSWHFASAFPMRWCGEPGMFSLWFISLMFF